MANSNRREWIAGNVVGDANNPAVRSYARKSGPGQIAHLFLRGGRKRGHTSMSVTEFKQDIIDLQSKLIDTVTGGTLYGAANLSRSHKALLPRVDDKLLKDFGLTPTSFDDLMKRCFAKKGTKLSDGTEVKESKNMVTVRGQEKVPESAVFDYYDTELVPEVVMTREDYEPIAEANRAFLAKAKAKYGISEEELDEDIPEV